MGGPVDTSSGVIGFVAAEAELVPTELVAVTLPVEAMSFVSPETVIGDEVTPYSRLASSRSRACTPF